MKLRVSQASDRGRRTDNEDNLLCAPALGLFAVADGIGGEEGGEVASHIATTVLYRHFVRRAPDLSTVGDMGLAFRSAHAKIVEAAEGRLHSMGTTLASLRIVGASGVVAHVGDSRVYRMREGELERLTIDHTVREQLRMQVGNLGPRSLSSMGDLLTRALAPRVEGTVELSTIEVRPGDTYLLCSDGVSKPLSRDTLEDVLMTKVEFAAGHAVQRALEAGGRDNATAVVVRVEAI